MIKSLRRKVFWSIFLIAAGVLLAILLAINILSLVQTASKRNSILESSLMMLQQDPEQNSELGPGPGRDDRRNDRDKSELMRSLSEDELGVIKLDESGSIVTRAGCATQLDEETVSSIAATALADTDGHGRIRGWEYKVFSLYDGIGISFLDAASLRQENVETALLSLAGFAIACGLFALVAWLLSKVIVKPVEENMQMQKRFVADASHELKTPLTVIDANTSVLEQSIGQNKWLDYIKEQTGRMAGLVNELLQLSNLEESNGADAAQQHAPFDAAEAVMAAALPFESVAFERGLTLETDTPDSLEVSGNRKDLEQLTAILIDNAIKHSAANGMIQVVLSKTSTKHGLKEEPIIELRVTNSGEDIPPEALPHIFDRFYRVDESRTYKDNSYGLGLAIAKGLTEKNNGNITVTSQKGVTEFSLSLPIRQ